MMLLDCPAYLDEDGALRCGLPAEVRCRVTMGSTDGFLESVMIRCPSGHWFNGPIEFVAPEKGRSTKRAMPKLLQAPAVTGSSALMMALTAWAGSSCRNPPGSGSTITRLGPACPA